MKNEAGTSVLSRQSGGAAGVPHAVGGPAGEDVLQVKLCDHLEDRHLGHLRLTGGQRYSPSGEKQPITAFRRC